MNASVLVTIPAVVPAEFPRGGDTWEAWLGDHIVPNWRPDEWDPQAWLFTGNPDNPQTSLWRCEVGACSSLLHARGWLCRHCWKAMDESGLGREEFVLSYAPQLKHSPGGVVGRCVVSRGDRRCCRPAICRGLCHPHHNRWFTYQKRPDHPRLALLAWSATATPFTDVPLCAVLGCDELIMNPRGLCALHWRRWRKHNKQQESSMTPQHWAATVTPYLGAGRFSLALLPAPLRGEVLLGLQRRDEIGRSIGPKAVRQVLAQLEGVTSLLTITPSAIESSLPSNAAQALFRDLHRSATLAFDEHRGVLPIAKDVLDLRAVGITSATRIGRRAQTGSTDLTVIGQRWLRELIRAWVDGERPHARYLGATVAAAVVAGQALSRRPGGGHDLTRVHFADMTTVVDQFRHALRKDGKPYSSRHRNALFGKFCALLDFGRSTGLLDDMSGSFARHHSHRIEVEDTNEDEIGKAIPEFVIRELDTQMDSLGAGIRYGQSEPAAVQAMFRTVYIVLRDTGRRPSEVASLPEDCLETINGETSLVWDNHKGKRNRRRLPITSDTAQTIRDWQTRRAALTFPAHSTGFLFPAITDDAAIPHLDTTNISRTIRCWVDGLATLNTDTTGDDGNPLPFDRRRIYPRAFRHSYAQRHADAGTPVDVLKELMDHIDVSTTMGYYTVSLKRKQAAVKTLNTHVLDRAGNPAPFTSPLAYQRSSVAVPFGGCTEPSNVKAGGGACRLRFQCAGCGFYRPDPSYLPAIEQQINDLRADRETAQAMDAAAFVTHNLTEQIHSYQDVAAKMRTHLAELPIEDRTEIEEASTIMRRARASSGHLRLPITPIKHKDDSP